MCAPSGTEQDDDRAVPKAHHETVASWWWRRGRGWVWGSRRAGRRRRRRRGRGGGGRRRRTAWRRRTTPGRRWPADGEKKRVRSVKWRTFQVKDTTLTGWQSHEAYTGAGNLVVPESCTSEDISVCQDAVVWKHAGIYAPPPLGWSSLRWSPLSWPGWASPGWATWPAYCWSGPCGPLQ